jgi:hypothetical protein
LKQILSFSGKIDLGLHLVLTGENCLADSAKNAWFKDRAEAAAKDAIAKAETGLAIAKEAVTTATQMAEKMKRDLTGARCGQRVLICTTAPNAPRCARPWVVDSGPYVAGRLIDALPQVLDVLGLDPARGVYRVTYSLLPIDDSRDDPKACWFPRWVGRPYWAHCER